MRPERKRSLSIAGHRTSLSLEAPFWEALKEIAASEGRPLAALVAEVDSGRGETNLSSALRLHALAHYRRLAGL
ncbi:ribbon-helix-helix domain-containing protein [Bosea sp. (in: a-proteobacteria)]|uniref:ribbon-helix-helix domain-containing protein n=1 Tax=Bosea sp. (in: a-proteobacteria) TaxID=1871050 RepID=UPI0026286BE0|nr:ribbon-helix-helix domain-containing protein [Bosea sp. (in: a-proteobacteria)]MCO5091930.1 ribbon-helix-helix domain-containing protein [Bosea sp. (in: a-proteobacteria)]